MFPAIIRVSQVMSLEDAHISVEYRMQCVVRVKGFREIFFKPEDEVN